MHVMRPVYPRELREVMVKVYKNKCQYCGSKSGAMSIDHIVPISKGGALDVSNLTLACLKCNKRKSSMTLPDLYTAIAVGRAESYKNRILGLLKNCDLSAAETTVVIHEDENEVVDLEKLDVAAEPPFKHTTHILALNERQAAESLGISVRTLQRLRIDGGGPRFFILGKKRVCYSKTSLIDYINARTVSNTGEKQALVKSHALAAKLPI